MRPPTMHGEECTDGIGVFHSTCASGPKAVGIAVSSASARPPGPRNCGHSPDCAARDSVRRKRIGAERWSMTTPARRSGPNMLSEGASPVHSEQAVGRSALFHEPAEPAQGVVPEARDAGQVVLGFRQAPRLDPPDALAPVVLVA